MLIYTNNSENLRAFSELLWIKICLFKKWFIAFAGVQFSSSVSVGGDSLGEVTLKRACMSSELFLKSCGFVLAFQCRLLQRSEALWSSPKVFFCTPAGFEWKAFYSNLSNPELTCSQAPWHWETLWEVSEALWISLAHWPFLSLFEALCALHAQALASI